MKRIQAALFRRKKIITKPKIKNNQSMLLCRIPQQQPIHKSTWRRKRLSCVFVPSLYLWRCSCAAQGEGTHTL